MSTQIHSINEFRRWYLPSDYLYEARVRFAAEHGVGRWLARSIMKAARGASVPETPESFYRDVERLSAERRRRSGHRTYAHAR